jgi:hypothetical protein
MKRRFLFFLSALTVGVLSSVPTSAQTSADPELLTDRPSELVSSTTRTLPSFNLRLNDRQRQTLRQATDLVFEPLDAFINGGLDPSKVDRSQLGRNANALREQIQSLRLDDTQTAELRRVLQVVREQVQQEVETTLPR